jgi:adenine/guanine phosphoribosyltransferase-like PRPP-binding protein
MKLSSILSVVKKYKGEIILSIGTILISLLSFLLGYIVAREDLKFPIETYESSYYRSRDIGSESVGQIGGFRS